MMIFSLQSSTTPRQTGGFDFWDKCRRIIKAFCFFMSLWQFLLLSLPLISVYITCFRSCSNNKSVYNQPKTLQACISLLPYSIFPFLPGAWHVSGCVCRIGGWTWRKSRGSRSHAETCHSSQRGKHVGLRPAKKPGRSQQECHLSFRTQRGPGSRYCRVKYDGLVFVLVCRIAVV